MGINLSGGKNMVGAFWQPKGVLIDVSVLVSLPEQEYRAGRAEVVKYGVILDANFFAYLEEHVEDIQAHDADTLRTVVERCCQLKADVVKQDEREVSGHRAVLNYGHTFAHAFEAASQYAQLLHGHAVSIGMMCAARLAERLGRVDSAFVTRQRNLLESLNLPLVVPDFDSDQILQLMHRDKKVAEGKLRFVLPDQLGHVELVQDVRVSDVLASLKD